jgi:hypothetical protein
MRYWVPPLSIQRMPMRMFTQGKPSRSAVRAWMIPLPM